MKTIKIKGGLDLRLAGEPRWTGETLERKEVDRVSVVGGDYVGMKPTICVEEGEDVLAGQILFEDKKNPGVKFTSPGAGKVKAINRGAKRAFESIEIELAPGADRDRSVEFEKVEADKIADFCPQRTRDILIRSGLWTALRTRPFSRSPRIDATPEALFVVACDTNPHAPSASAIINRAAADFVNGVRVLTLLGAPKTFVCTAGASSKSELDADLDASLEAIPTVERVHFQGKHPAGLAGTHIAKLRPCGLTKVVWTIGYQDAIAIGRLFTTGAFPTERAIAISGPMVKDPRVVSTRLGASVSDLLAGELVDGEYRAISGCVLCGREVTATRDGLGRFANQVCVIADGDPRELLGWATPNFSKFSVARTVASTLFHRGPFNMTTAQHGGVRSVFPNPYFEKVTPLDLEPTFLFKALEIGDLDACERLGAFELDEEDLALCTLVDFGKNDYGRTLRAVLDKAMKEEA